MRQDQPEDQDRPILLDKLREDLDADAERIDAANASRLNRARQAALAQLDSSPPRERNVLWWWGGGVSAALSCALIMVVWFGQNDSYNNTMLLEQLVDSSIADNDLLADQAGLEFFDELDFYRWLEDQGIESDDRLNHHEV